MERAAIAGTMGDFDSPRVFQNGISTEEEKDSTKSESRTGGIFTPLKTTMEVRTREELVDVYVVRVPVKMASTVLG